MVRPWWSIRCHSGRYVIVRHAADLPFLLIRVRRGGLGGVPKLRPSASHRFGGSMSDRFSQGVGALSAGLGLVRNHVRQELVLRQLTSHLVGGRHFSILDAGCGQGTLVIELARLGHRVVGLDQSTEILGLAETALATEEKTVRQRMTL